MNARLDKAGNSPRSIFVKMAKPSPATHAKFFERNGKLLLEIHHGEPEKTCLERKATACDRETFKAEYGIYKSTGGKL
jgi:hypothetical protein